MLRAPALLGAWLASGAGCVGFAGCVVLCSLFLVGIVVSGGRSGGVAVLCTPIGALGSLGSANLRAKLLVRDGGNRLYSKHGTIGRWPGLSACARIWR